MRKRNARDHAADREAADYRGVPATDVAVAVLPPDVQRPVRAAHGGDETDGGQRGPGGLPRRIAITYAVALLALVAVFALRDRGSDATRPAAAAAATPAPTPRRGEEARAARAVEAVGRALRDGDVARLCAPGALLTGAVVASLGREGTRGGSSYGSFVEDRLAGSRPGTLEVMRLTLARDLGTAW